MHLLQSCSLHNTCSQVDMGTSCYSDSSCGKGIVSKMSRERFSGAHHNTSCAELFYGCIFNEKSFDCRRVYLPWCPCVVELLLLITLLDLGGERSEKTQKSDWARCPFLMLSRRVSNYAIFFSDVSAEFVVDVPLTTIVIIPRYVWSNTQLVVLPLFRCTSISWIHVGEWLSESVGYV